jgi:ligand-binding SRPBCC domain-containing protein
MIRLLEQAQDLPITREEAWAFFSDARNLKEITPAGLGFEMVSGGDAPVHKGQIIAYRVRVLRLVKLKWETEIVEIEEGVSFVDVQRAGPFKYWRHRHAFEEVECGVRMTDRVEYAVGWGPFGWLARKLFVRRQLEQVFADRIRLLEERFGRMG